MIKIIKLILVAILISGLIFIWLYWSNKGEKEGKINLEEEILEKIGVWCQLGENGEQCYWLNGEGVVGEKAPRPRGSLVWAIDADESIEAISGKKILEKNLWENIKKIMNFPFFSEWLLEQVAVDWQRQELRGKLVAGAEIKFSINFNPENNLAGLEKLVEEEKINLKNLEYIDLRIENRIYYK